MAYVGKFKFAACFAAVALSLVSSASRADTPPAPQGEPYHLSESDFRDLRDYMNYAKKALENALDTARSLPDAEAHQALVEGITAALKQGSTGDDLLLFRYELGRALEIDTIFTTGTGAETLAASSSSVLIPSIDRALQYYRSDDDPRMHSVETFLPDWAGFVHDQIPIWLRTADFAPQAARQQIVMRALGWAARALNKSVIARRNFAEQIVALADLESAIEAGRASFSEGEQLLLKTAQALGGTQSTTTSTPTSAFPGTDHSKDPTAGDVLRSTFPIDSGGQVGTGDWTKGDGAFPSGFEFGANIAIGGGVTSGPGGATKMGQASGDAMIFGGMEYGAIVGIADVKGTLGDAARTPIYTFKASGGFVGGFAYGAWGAFEANQFLELKEQFARVGWGTTIPIMIGTHQYVLVRFGLGGSFGGIQSPESIAAANNPKNSVGGGGFTWDFTAILKLAKFFIRIDATQDYNAAGPQNLQATRTDVALQLAVPLHLIFKTDEIRFEGRLIDYSPEGDANFSNTMVTTAGAYYGLRW